LKTILSSLVLVLACDSKPSSDAKTTPAEEPVLCGLHQAESNAAMLAVSQCTAKASALAAEAKTDPPTCEDERETLVAANEKFIGCIDAQSGGGGDVAGAVRKMKTLTDDMCACKDKACAEKVTADMVKYGEEMAKKQAGKAEPKVSEAQKKEMDETMTRLSDCLTKAMGS
jgi:hypothetical protein